MIVIQSSLSGLLFHHEIKFYIPDIGITYDLCSNVEFITSQYDDDFHLISL